MRVLHVGFGFRPWIVNGLVTYLNDLMQTQVLAGEEVGYFCAGRQLPRVRRPFLHRWRREGIQMFEWINSTLVVGGHRGSPEPDRDLSDAPTQRAFAQVMRDFGPDVVHVHDLGGLPSSLLELSRAQDTSVVLTLHDYFALCPTVKLFDAEGHICDRRRPGTMCLVCCAAAPSDNHQLVSTTLRYQRGRLRSRWPQLDAALRWPPLERAGAAAIRLTDRASGLSRAMTIAEPPVGADTASIGLAPAGPEAYDRRRELNVQRLSRLDAVITFSDRSRQICAALGVDTERFQTLRMNPAHIPRLRPRPATPATGRLRFAALNACSSTQKGANLLLAAVRELSARGLDDRYRLLLRGPVVPWMEAALAAHPSVELGGDYSIEELDELLDDVDVGLVPSVWEEIYGFVGLEFLAKGIPVIGNALGGIPEYVHPGRTGWLNRTSSPRELADLMGAAIADPAEVQRLAAGALQLGDELIVSMSAQVAELSAVYTQVRGV
jgi:hypothetical protein